MKDVNVFESSALPPLMKTGRRIIGDHVFSLMSYPVDFQGENPDGEWITFFTAENREDIEYRLQNYGLNNEYVAMRAVTADGNIFHHTIEDIIKAEKNAEIQSKQQLEPLQSFAKSSPLDAIKTATEIMMAAEASQHFTIPVRATVMINHPSLHRIVFMEFEDSVSCRLFVTTSQVDTNNTVTIWKMQHPSIIEDRREDDIPDNFPPFAMTPNGIPANTQTFLFLLCASIVRDFWVLNEISRRNTYQKRTEKKRQRVGKGKYRKLEVQKEYIFIPRFKYNLDAYNTQSKTAVEHNVRVTLSPALVSGHIRKLHKGWKTSEEAIENAQEFGISKLAPGTTFVRPHSRGAIEQLRNYRSRSALQLLFEDH